MTARHGERKRPIRSSAQWHAYFTANAGNQRDIRWGEGELRARSSSCPQCGKVSIRSSDIAGRGLAAGTSRMGEGPVEVFSDR